jgi:LysR family transcriptional activator of nhaA
MGSLMEWLNYHHLYYFWTVMHEGSLTAASQRLRLAPSTVSAQLASLEQALGGKLFSRIGRGLEPTDLGRTVFRYANEIFSLGKELMDTVRGRSAAGRLSLRVGVLNVLPKLIVRKILEPALDLAESIQLLCYEHKKEQLLAELAVYKVDVVLSDSPVPRGFHVRAYNHFLGECGVTFLAVRTLANQYRKGFPKSLSEAPMLLPLQISASRQALERWFESLHIKPMIVWEIEDSALLKEFGRHGDGIFAVASVIEKEVASQYNLEVVGRSDAVRERFYAVSFERIIKHPAVTAISNAARQSLFVQEKRSS